jgi:hypothetical protein
VEERLASPRLQGQGGPRKRDYEAAPPDAKEAATYVADAADLLAAIARNPNPARPDTPEAAWGDPRLSRCFLSAPCQLRQDVIARKGDRLLEADANTPSTFGVACVTISE